MNQRRPTIMRRKTISQFISTSNFSPTELSDSLQKNELDIEGYHKTMDALAGSDCATPIREDRFADFLPTSDFDGGSGPAHSAF
jgi:hypothetical protein